MAVDYAVAGLCCRWGHERLCKLLAHGLVPKNRQGSSESLSVQSAKLGQADWFSLADIASSDMAYYP
eukprot:scaffold61012_cov42-Prasinocladus_malaysianus.AAC.1